MKGDFKKCLTMFFNIKSIKSDVFTWLEKIKEDCLSEENKSENEEQTKKVKVTKDEMK